MRDMMGMMKEMAGLKARMEAMQAELETTLVEGRSGGGMVRVTLTAKGAMKTLEVDASLMNPDEKEILEDLVVAAADGSFYILERNGNALRFVDAAGKIRTLVSGTLNGPKHACLDRDGSVIIADAENHVIHRYDPKTKELTRIAGSGKKGATLTDDALTSDLSRPHGVTIAPDGALIITDSYNDRILRMAR